MAHLPPKDMKVLWCSGLDTPPIIIASTGTRAAVLTMEARDLVPMNLIYTIMSRVPLASASVTAWAVIAMVMSTPIVENARSGRSKFIRHNMCMGWIATSGTSWIKLRQLDVECSWCIMLVWNEHKANRARFKEQFHCFSSKMISSMVTKKQTMLPDAIKTNTNYYLNTNALCSKQPSHANLQC